MGIGLECSICKLPVFVKEATHTVHQKCLNPTPHDRDALLEALAEAVRTMLDVAAGGQTFSMTRINYLRSAIDKARRK